MTERHLFRRLTLLAAFTIGVVEPIPAQASTEPRSEAEGRSLRAAALAALIHKTPPACRWCDGARVDAIDRWARKAKWEEPCRAARLSYASLGAAGAVEVRGQRRQRPAPDGQGAGAKRAVWSSGRKVFMRAWRSAASGNVLRQDRPADPEPQKDVQHPARHDENAGGGEAHVVPARPAGHMYRPEDGQALSRAVLPVEGRGPDPSPGDREPRGAVERHQRLLDRSSGQHRRIRSHQVVTQPGIEDAGDAS